MPERRRATKATGKQVAGPKATRRAVAHRQSEAAIRREIAELDARIDRDLASLQAETDRLVAKVLR